MTDTHRTLVVDSPVGPLTLVASDQGLRAVLWPDDTPARVPVPDHLDDGSDDTVLSAAATQLDEYFRGERTEFDIPLDLRGTEFQEASWQALADIPFGETSSYAEHAERLGRPTAVRAVGAATGRNPISVILPCHRIIGADGSLTGFAGGLETKRWLLDHEQVVASA